MSDSGTTLGAWLLHSAAGGSMISMYAAISLSGVVPCVKLATVTVPRLVPSLIGPSAFTVELPAR